MNKNLLKSCILILLILGLALGLTACRQSLVIARIIHDQQAQEQDTQSPPLVSNNPESDLQDEELPQQETTEATRPSQVQTQATEAGAQTNPGTAPQTIYHSSSSNHRKADRSGSKSGKSGKSGGGKSGSGGSGGSTGGETGGTGGTRQIYDDDGNVVDLPDDVNAVVAAGDAALMVQMLGGNGILAGSSASVIGSALTQNIFADEGIDGAQAYWDGTGNSPMSDANFQVLLANKPDVCVGSGSSFSDNQIAQLKASGIAYVSVPKLNSPDNIEKAVSILGKLIGNRSKQGGLNAKSIASDYIDYCDDLTRSVSRAVGNNAEKCYSLYVVGWDAAATFSIPQAGFQESGVAYASGNPRPVSDYMKIGGVTDNATSYQMSAATDYAIVPLNINVEDNVSVTNGLELLRKTDNNSFVLNSSYQLGKNQFQWIIADSQYTAACIDASRMGGGMWTPFGRVTATSGSTSVTDWGFLAGDRIVRTNIRGDYQIAVNPCGAGSWADGSPESVLECIWVAWKIAGVYREADVRNEIRAFYSRFYRYDLSDGEITEILAGMQ